MNKVITELIVCIFTLSPTQTHNRWAGLTFSRVDEKTVSVILNFSHKGDRF